MVAERPRRAAAAAALALVAGEWPRATAWRTWGELPLDSEFVQYVGKFCFDYSKTEKAGAFRLVAEGAVAEMAPPAGTPPSTVQPGSPCWGPCDPYGGLYLIVYDDEKAHWRAAHKDWASLTCKERLDDASWAARISPFDANQPVNRKVLVSERIRPRFWYFTFVACGVTVVKPVKFSIHAENLLQAWEHEFGVDETGTLTLQILFTFIFGILACTMRASTTSLGRGEAFRARPLLRLLVFSALFSMAGCAFLSLHYAVYGSDGIGLRAIEVCGVVWASLSKAMLSILQLLSAKGWVLFYSPNEIAWRRFTVCTLGGVIVASTACEIHGQYFHDWRTTLYLYESTPGILILFLNLVLFIEASRSMYNTYWNEVSEEIRDFYRTISAAILVYYLSLPLVCVLAGLFSPWVRQKYVARTEIIARLVAMMMMAYCLRPSRLDIIINSRLQEGLDSDMCDSPEGEDFLDEDDEEDQEVARPLKGGYASVQDDDVVGEE